jgi:cytosine/creatinine deaminase
VIQMSHHTETSCILSDVLVPYSLVSRPDQFGGRRENDCLRGDLVIRNGRVQGLCPSAGQGGSKGVVIPKLTECHVHLDKCHSISRLQNIGRDLRAAIEAQAVDRAAWTPEDVRVRASGGIEELIAAGCGVARTHVDWGHGAAAVDAPMAWDVLRELSWAYRDQLTLQVAPLMGIDDLADLTIARHIAKRMTRADNVLGAFVLDQPNRQNGIDNAFAVADQFGLALDFHVDEGLSDGLNGLELIADKAIETGFQGPVLCGHACSLANMSGHNLQRVIDKIVQAGLTIAALPTTNLYLQGRRQGTPDRRGITLIHELRAAGVPVVIGTDNVCDAFCPIGRHDPRRSLSLAILAAHLDPPFGDLFPLITTNAERALGLAPNSVDGAAIGGLLLFDATSVSGALECSNAPRALSDVLKGEPA